MKKNIILTIIGFLLVCVAIHCEGPIRYINIPEDDMEQPAEGVPQDFSHTGPPVVFIGNSITEIWPAEFFARNGYVKKGISGQTSATIRNRFDNDVIALDPQCVVISAGTNDAAQNGGYVSPEGVLSNIDAMVQKAKTAHIKVFLASVTPACSFWWDTNGLQADYIKNYIKELNALIIDYADMNNCTYVDYYSALKDDSDCAPTTYFYDGVHPSAAGFAVMEDVIQPLLEKALK